MNRGPHGAAHGRPSAPPRPRSRRRGARCSARSVRAARPWGLRIWGAGAIIAQTGHRRDRLHVGPLWLYGYTWRQNRFEEPTAHPMPPPTATPITVGASTRLTFGFELG